MSDVSMSEAESNKDDVKMEDASNEEKPKQEEKKIEDPETRAINTIKGNIKLIEKSVASSESRFISRVFRSIASLRKELTNDVLSKVIQQVIPAKRSEFLTTASKYVVKASFEFKPSPSNTPEVEIYLHLLICIFLIDQKRHDEATECCTSLIVALKSFASRPTMNLLAAKSYFYYSRSYELKNQLSSIRGTLLSIYRTAALKRNDEAQATLINLLLRNYLHYNLYDQADKLVSKTTVSDNCSSDQLARNYYYLGKIKSVQLEYTEANAYLQQAIRKAPQHTAFGFKIAVHKLSCIVQLLMGEVPEREPFRSPNYKKSLDPYFRLTQAVRIGDLEAFHNVVNTETKTFLADKTYTLIQRLRFNVIKTGLKKISVSYSRISLSDVCAKLRLDSIEDAELIVAKAIRDGVIDAVINHEEAYLQSKDKVDIYSTLEPQQTFHSRINFCLNIHNDAVKAMRFPDKKPKVQDPSGLAAEEVDVNELMEDDDFW